MTDITDKVEDKDETKVFDLHCIVKDWIDAEIAKKDINSSIDWKTTMCYKCAGLDMECPQYSPRKGY